MLAHTQTHKNPARATGHYIIIVIVYRANIVTWKPIKYLITEIFLSILSRVINKGFLTSHLKRMS